MDDRKRRLSSPVPAGGNSAQKRKMMALDTSDSPSSKANDHNHEQAGSLDASLGLDEGFLEAFTKAAIHRQMLEYKRELERSQNSAEKLERDCKASQSRLVHTEECWKQLNDELKAVLGEYEELNTSNGHAAGHEEGQDNDDDDDDDDTEDELESPIRLRLQQTRHYLNQLVQRTNSASGGSANTKDLATRYEALSAQLIESRSSHNLLKSLVSRKQEELNETRSALLSLEKKVDRARSSTVAKLEKHDTGTAAIDTPSSAQAVPKKEDESTANGAPAAAAASEDVKMGEADEAGASASAGKDAKEDENDLQEGSSGLSRSEIQELQMLAEMRAKEVEELQDQKVKMQVLLDEARRDARSRVVSIDVLKNQPDYQKIDNEVLALREQAKNNEAELKILREEAALLREGQATLQDAISKEHIDAISTLEKKFAETHAAEKRLRLERDKLQKDYMSFQAYYNERISYAAHVMRLVESRNKRIGALVSQVTRLEMKLAANTGNGNNGEETESLLNRLEASGKTQADLASASPPQPAQTKPGEPAPPAEKSTQDLLDYMGQGDVPTPAEMLLSEYQKKIDEQDELISTFRNRLDELSGHPGKEDLDMAENLIREAATANLKVEKANARIAQLEALLGSSTDPSVTSATVAKKLQDDEATIKKLEANLKVSESSMQMLITEVTRLSEAWEILNVSNQNKVFHLAQYADKLDQVNRERNSQRLQIFKLERASKEDLQKKALQDQFVKSQKEAISAQKVEIESIQSKLNSSEKEVTELTKYKVDHEKKITTLEADLNEARKDRDSIVLKLQVANATSLGHNESREKDASARRRAEAEAARYKEQADSWKERANKATAAASEKPRFTSGKADAVYTERLESMLHCNACSVNWLSHTITRCYHVFCKDCIDARLETRQRKCPSCSIPFGAQDVQQLFLQNG